jgi:hypothetical protein
LSIAGTRPIAWSAKKLATTPDTLGSSTPTASPCAAWRLERAAERQAAGDQPLVAQRLALDVLDHRALPPWISLASSSAWNSVRSMSDVAKIMLLISS